MIHSLVHLSASQKAVLGIGFLCCSCVRAGFTVADASPDAPFDTDAVHPVDRGPDTGPRPPLPGPYLLCYSFHGPAGHEALDISGQGRHAACAGATCPSAIPGRVGGALSFDGVDDHLRIAHDGGFTSVATALSVTVWIRRESADTSNAHVVAVPYGVKKGDSWEIWIDGPKKSLCFSIHVTGREEWVCTPAAVVEDGAWHHVAGVSDGATISLYIDGAKIASKPAGTIVFDGQDLLVGADINFEATSNYWKGDLDELCVYRRALGAAEVQSLVAP